MKQEIIRKLIAAVAMSLVVGVSLAACGGGSSSTAAGVTKTGSAEGFGGAVTATLTVDANGTVTDCKLEGAQETESIGGAALEELSKQVVAANGPAIDGVAGATVTTKAVRKAVAAALGVELAEEAPADSAAAAPAEPAADALGHDVQRAAPGARELQARGVRVRVAQLHVPERERQPLLRRDGKAARNAQIVRLHTEQARDQRAVRAVAMTGQGEAAVQRNVRVHRPVACLLYTSPSPRD